MCTSSTPSHLGLACLECNKDWGDTTRRLLHLDGGLRLNMTCESVGKYELACDDGNDWHACETPCLLKPTWMTASTNLRSPVFTASMIGSLPLGVGCATTRWQSPLLQALQVVHAQPCAQMAYLVDVHVTSHQFLDEQVILLLRCVMTHSRHRHLF